MPWLFCGFVLFPEAFLSECKRKLETTMEKTLAANAKLGSVCHHEHHSLLTFITVWLMTTKKTSSPCLHRDDDIINNHVLFHLMKPVKSTREQKDNAKEVFHCFCWFHFDITSSNMQWWGNFVVKLLGYLVTGWSPTTTTVGLLNKLTPSCSKTVYACNCKSIWIKWMFSEYNSWGFFKKNILPSLTLAKGSLYIS